MDGGAWQATIHTITESDLTGRLSARAHTHSLLRHCFIQTFSDVDREEVLRIDQIVTVISSYSTMCLFYSFTEEIEFISLSHESGLALEVA